MLFYLLNAKTTWIMYGFVIHENVVTDMMRLDQKLLFQNTLLTDNTSQYR